MNQSQQSGLVYIGQITEINPIPNADLIVSATVVCGQGGKWRGVIRKSFFTLNEVCVVYLPDCLLDPGIYNTVLPFMEKAHWRVKMCRFRGSPSEVLITDMSLIDQCYPVGTDVTHLVNVTKYHKPVSLNLNGIAKGYFPSFIPKTDEPNYQCSLELIDSLEGKPYYVTEKCDGSSTTAYRYKGQFGVCSRNLELERDDNNGYWKVANKYQLEQNLPEGYALQWETCGPGIQSNPMGLKEIDGFAFSGYKIDEHRYLEASELWSLLHNLQFPSANVIEYGPKFSKEDLETLGEGAYSNGRQREGVVVRSQVNVGHRPISFKVINLNYEA